MGDPNNKIFGQDSTYLKHFLKKKSVDELQLVKKCQNRSFKVNFLCKKSYKFFPNFFFIEEHQFRSTFFDKINFQITLLLKLCPIYGSLPLINWLLMIYSLQLVINDLLPLIKNSKFNNFLWVCLFLCKNISNFVSSS